MNAPKPWVAVAVARRPRSQPAARGFPRLAILVLVLAASAPFFAKAWGRRGNDAAKQVINKVTYK